MDLDETGQLFILYFVFVNYSRWNGNTTKQCFKKTYDLIRRNVLYNILIEFGNAMKLMNIIQMWLNETYSRVRVSKNLSEEFPIKYALI
jgi:type IV secretory pathway VirB6-like protein